MELAAEALLSGRVLPEAGLEGLPGDSGALDLPRGGLGRLVPAQLPAKPGGLLPPPGVPGGGLPVEGGVHRPPGVGQVLRRGEGPDLLQTAVQVGVKAGGQGVPGGPGVPPGGPGLGGFFI